MKQFPALNPIAAAAARDEAMAAVHADAAWRADYFEAILMMANQRDEANQPVPFLMEDATAICGFPPPGCDHRAIGPVTMQAVKGGYIKPTGVFRNGRAVSRHKTLMREWVST